MSQFSGNGIVTGTVSYEGGKKVRGWVKEDPVNHSKGFWFYP